MDCPDCGDSQTDWHLCLGNKSDTRGGLALLVADIEAAATMSDSLSGVTDVMRGQSDEQSIGLVPLYPERPQGPLTPFGEALQSLSQGLTQVVRVQLSEADRNRYYDGIILAARKKREKGNGAAGLGERPSREQVRWAINCIEQAKRASRLSSAMSLPLDFSVSAYRGVPVDE